MGIFDSKDDTIKEEVLKIAKELKEKKQFVDTKIYKMQCGVCYALLKGNTEAVAHSKGTGHTNFTQLDN